MHASQENLDRFCPPTEGAKPALTGRREHDPPSAVVALPSGEHQLGGHDFSADTMSVQPAQGPVSGPYLSDIGNAERFVSQHAGRVRYVSTWDAWYVWDGRKWSLDDKGAVVELAKRTAKLINAEAVRADNLNDQKAITTHARTSQSKPRLDAMIALAKSDAAVATRHGDLDNDPWLINFENGTVDLRTGVLRDHDPADLITMTTGIDFAVEPGEDPVKWSEFLDQTFGGDAELIAYLQRIFGQALIGEQREHVLPILHGGGANGKSVFVGVLQHVFGDYAGVAAPGLFTSKETDESSRRVADLQGRRLVVLQETGEGAKLNEPLVKSITGGDKLKGRRLYQDYFEFTPSHLPVMVTNHRPVIVGVDHGIWRRVALIPFEHTVPDEEQDPHLLAELRKEGPAIARWLVAGCLAWQKEGLAPPRAVAASTTEYRQESDTVGQWLAEDCVVQQHAEATAAQLLRSYNSRAAKVHERERSQRWLGGQLAQRGFQKTRTNRGVVYRGVGVIDDASAGSEPS